MKFKAFSESYAKPISPCSKAEHEVVKVAHVEAHCR